MTVRSEKTKYRNQVMISSFIHRILNGAGLVFRSIRNVDMAILCERCKNLQSLLLSFFVLLVLIVSLLIIAMELNNGIRKKSIVIGSFDVPESLKKYGYTEKVLVNKIIDRLDMIRIESGKERQTKPRNGERKDRGIESSSPSFLSDSFSETPVINVSGVSVSPRLLVEYIRELYGESRVYVTGDIVLDKGNLHFTIRIPGEPEATFSERWDESLKIKDSIDSAVSKSAEFLFKVKYPLSLLRYYAFNEIVYGKNPSQDIRYKNAESAALSIIENVKKSDEEKAWAYNLWGYLLYINEQYEGALAKLNESKRLKSDDDFSFFMLGKVYQKIEEKEKWDRIKKEAAAREAEQMFNTVIKQKGKYAKNAYLELGNLFFKEDDYHSATNNYEEAIRQDREYAKAYYNLGVALFHNRKGNRKNKEEEDLDRKAEEQLSRAIALDPAGKFVANAKSILAELRLGKKE